MVTSHRNVVGHLLGSYRTRERDMLSAPHDPELRRGFEDTAATLCQVMRERTAREAALAAETYVGRRRPGAHGTGTAAEHHRTPEPVDEQAHGPAYERPHEPVYERPHELAYERRYG